MKKLHILRLSLLLLLVFACAKQENQDTQPRNNQLCEGAALLTFSIPCAQNLTIEFPDCFTLLPSIGIDTHVGVFSAATEGVEIHYDIGMLAGNYVDANSPNKQVFQSVNEEFWYEQKNGKLYFTFPAAGPANFYTDDTAFADDIIQYMKTLESN